MPQNCLEIQGKWKQLTDIAVTTAVNASYCDKTHLAPGHLATDFAA